MPAGRDGYRHFHAFATRWFDNDVYGHLNNSVHYQIFDTAVNAHLVENGLLDIETSDAVFLVVESGCRYHAPLRFPDEVVAGLRVGHLGSTSVRYEIGLFGRGGESAAAEGFFVHVLVDRRSGGKRPIPAATRTVLSRLTA